MASTGVDGEITRRTMPSEKLHTAAAIDENEGPDTCRICRGEATPEQPLYYPCKCSGSIKHVHQECLMEWLSHSQKKYCELCKTSFRFTKLYDQSMPEVLPVPLFLHRIAWYGAKAVGRWIRYAVVITVWTCCLPWAIRHVWRGLFWLADWNWLTEREMHQLLTSDAHLNISNSTANATMTSLPAATQTVLIPSLTPLSLLLHLFTGDALLRGLLRLFTSTKVAVPLSTSPLDVQNATLLSDPIMPRRPSLLSDIESLNTFTRYPSVNNSLVDILEGQLICLSIIATFILVFLIREWVINQQPVHLMPDADQADVPVVPRPQEDIAAEAARRRRLHLHRVLDQEGLEELRAVEIVQRPRAIPRTRRIPMEEHIPLDTPDPLPSPRLEVPTRSTSPSHLNHSDGGSTEATGESTHGFSASAGPSIESRPVTLQRGVLDEAVGIRRSIEERTSQELFDVKDIPALGNDSINYEQHVSPGESLHRPATTQLFDFATFANRNESREFTFTAAQSLGNSDAPGPETVDEPQQHQSEAVPVETVDEPRQHQFEAMPVEPVAVEADTSTDSDDAVATPQTSESERETVHSSEAITQNEAQPTNIATDLLPPDDVEPESEARSELVQDPVPDQGLMQRTAAWLWRTEGQQLPTTPEASVVDTIRNGHEPEMVENAVVNRDPVRREVLNAGPNLVPAPILAPVPAPAPNPVPNVQPGLDLNDPNAIDDAEDLEGMLELIGMEGPITGMIQNLIFSVFLVTLTLSASVWCPYIWGKIALLVLSNPVGIFFKAPLLFFSRVADGFVDLSLLLVGALGLVVTNTTRVIKFLTVMVLPQFGRHIRIGYMEKLAVNLTQTSSARLEKALSVTVFYLRPDLPTFSMQSHHALRVFKGAFFDIINAIAVDIHGSWSNAVRLWHSSGILSLPLIVFHESIAIPQSMLSLAQGMSVWFPKFSNELQMTIPSNSDDMDLSLFEWKTKDKILTIAIGYTSFAIAGFVYLKIARIYAGLKSDEKLEGVLADSLRQAGGVAKVIIIIGIEMIVFPLYCGCLLDVALLPLFREATVASRLEFIFNAPLTGLFIHWFIGTCYMFHFALFVSMCRKIMRRGVLYFIRDPDDPTFHPVRDVLERPVATQLSKIGFSACVYGGLVLVCLGGVVWTIAAVGSVFPIQWATPHPRLAFPLDVLFIFFFLPFLVRNTEPSKKISSMYEWWFRRCARSLRLSHFLFNEQHPDEIRTTSTSTRNGKLDTLNKHREFLIDGKWVRAPASDSVRIPKGTKVFLEVNGRNERVDGKTDLDKGLHGKGDDRFAKIFIPPAFRVRIATFVFLVWLFAACTGATLTLGPLIIGRIALGFISESQDPPNDLYALTVGVHLAWTVIMALFSLLRYRKAEKANRQGVFSNIGDLLPMALRKTRYALGLLYLGLFFGLVLPFLLSLLLELYILMPLYENIAISPTFVERIRFMASGSATSSGLSPQIFLVQSWTLGVLFLRLLLHVSVRFPNDQTQLATAVRSVMRNGILHPDVRLASRALILPISAMTSALVILPLLIARFYIAVSHNKDDAHIAYRLSYPILLLTAIAVYLMVHIKQKMVSWRARVRDEVYLVGERLHNFTDAKNDKNRSESRKSKEGKGKERDIEVTSDETSIDEVLNHGLNMEGDLPSDALRHEEQDQDLSIPGSSSNVMDIDIDIGVGMDIK